MTDGEAHVELSRAWGYTASDAFRASAAFFRSLPEDAWGGPTGCAEWDQRYLCGHILGEAVWFPNTLRGIVQGEAAHPASLYEEMMEWAPERQARRMDEAAGEIRAVIDVALPDHADDTVDVGWSRVPLW